MARDYFDENKKKKEEEKQKAAKSQPSTATPTRQTQNNAQIVNRVVDTVNEKTTKAAVKSTDLASSSIRKQTSTSGTASTSFSSASTYRGSGRSNTRAGNNDQSTDTGTQAYSNNRREQLGRSTSKALQRTRALKEQQEEWEAKQEERLARSETFLNSKQAQRANADKANKSLRNEVKSELGKAVRETRASMNDYGAKISKEDDRRARQQQKLGGPSRNQTLGIKESALGRSATHQTIEGTLKQTGGGYLKSLGDDGNQYSEYKSLLDHKVAMGDITQSEADRLLNNAVRSNRLWQRQQDWESSNQHKTFQSLYKKGQELYSEGTEQLQQAQEGAGALKKAYLGALSSGTGMAADMATGPAWFVSMVARTYGAERGNVEAMGGTEWQDRNYAGLQAMLEAGTEYMFQGIGLSRAAVSRGPKGLSLADRIGKKILAKQEGRFADALSGFYRLATGVGEENIEEAVAWGVSPLIARATYANDLWARDSRNMLHQESDALRQEVSGMSREEVEAIASYMATDDFTEKMARDYIDSGAPEDQAYEIAGLMKDYLTASITGDKKSEEEIEEQLMSILQGQNPYDQGWSKDELIETLAATTLLTAATGLPGAVTTSQLGHQIFNSEEMQKKFGSKAVDIIANEVINSSDSKMSIKAQAMKDRLDSGKDLTGTQKYELYQAYQQKVQDTAEEMDVSDKTIELESKRNNYVPTVRGYDSEGKPVFMKATQAAYETTYESALARAEDIGKYIRSEKADQSISADENVRTEAAAQAVSHLDVGALTVGDAHEFAYGNNLARETLKAELGIDLNQYVVRDKAGNVDYAATNRATEEALFKINTQNALAAAKVETDVFINDRKGAIDTDLISRMGAQGQAIWKDINKDLDPRNTSEYLKAGNAASFFYSAGRNTDMSVAEAVAKYGVTFKGVDANIMKRAFAAGSRDRVVLNTPGYGQTITAGENMQIEDSASVPTGQLILDPGLQLDDETQKLYLSLAQSTGTNVRIVGELVPRDENGNPIINRYTGRPQQINGMSKGDTIVLNMNADAESNLGYVFMHEMTHQIKKYAPEQYAALENLIRDRWFHKDNAGMQNAIREKISLYKQAANEDLSADDAMEEIVADAMAEVIDDPDFAAEICEQDEALGRSILNSIKSALRSLRQMFSADEYKNNNFHDSLLSYLGVLSEAERLWIEALHAARLNRATRSIEEWNEDASERKSVGRTTDGRYVVVVNDRIFATDYNERDNLRAVKTALRSHQTIPVSGQVVKVTRRSRNEIVGSGDTRALRTNDKQAYEDKLNALAHPFDIIYASTNYVNESPNHPRKDNFTQFARGEVLLQIQGRQYKAEVVCGITRSGSCELYDVVRMDPVKFELEIYSNNKKEIASYDSTRSAVSDGGSPTKYIPQFAEEGKKSISAQDADYMAAVESGDMETARQMVEQRATEMGFADAVPEQTLSYKTRTGRPPQKTKKVYKVFTVDEQGRPSALFVSGVDPLPQNVWLDAQDTWHFENTRNGRFYVPSTKNPNTEGGKTGGMIPRSEISDADWQELVNRGYVKENSKSVTALAYRPGWHAGDIPFFPQGGTKVEGSNYENIHRFNQVVFECEMAYDIDYTKTHSTKDGQVAFDDMQELPENGGYEFATNPMAHAEDIGKWFISSSLKIGRALTEEECNEILESHGRLPQEWQASEYQEKGRGKNKTTKLVGVEKTIGHLDLEKLGYTGEQFDAARKTLAPVTYDDNGNVIPLSERFNPENEDIRYSLGYHAGDLGKSTVDDYRHQGYGRGSGHFGFGTYFVGDEEQINYGDYGKRSHETVEFDNYNLFRPRDFDQGLKLHDALRVIDGLIKEYSEFRQYDIWNDDTRDERYYKSSGVNTDIDRLTDDYYWDGQYDPERKARIDQYISEMPEGYRDEIERKAEQTYNDAQNASEDENDARETLSARYDIRGSFVYDTKEEYIEGNIDDYLDNIRERKKVPFEQWRYEAAQEVIKEYSEAWENTRLQLTRLAGNLQSALGYAHRETEIIQALEETERIVKGYGEGYRMDLPPGLDSGATVFMKLLGYEGVDVRHIREMDNTGYGSVIYDLKGEDLARKQEIGTAKFSVPAYSPEEMQAHRDALAEDMEANYGASYTETFSEAGYVFPNGKMLKMGMYGQRGDDHAIAGLAYDDIGYDTYFSPKAEAQKRFINEGNIRYMPENGWLNFGTKIAPTREQYDWIEDVAAYEGVTMIEFTDEDNNTADYKEYSGDTPGRVIAEDVRSFYRDGEIRKSDMDGFRYSISSTAEAVGLTFAVQDGRTVFKDAAGNVIEDFTPEMLADTPIGRVLTLAASNGFKVMSNKAVKDRLKFLSDLLNMINTTQNPDLIWAVSGTLGYNPQRLIDENTPQEKINESKSKFASITGNADPQYKTTIDFTTICVKTQAVIDAMSAVMKRMHRGLTEHEIIDIVYNETKMAGEQVPCPVCYVFSRWVGLGGLFTNIKNFQERYPEGMDMSEIRKTYDALSKQVDKIAKREGIKGGKAREVLYKETIRRWDELDEQRNLNKMQGKEELTAEEQTEFDKLTKDLEVLDHWSWLGNTRLADDYKEVPDDILFDINAGREFATEYPAVWRFRTTRGPSLGKAAAPYSPSRLGDTIRGIGSPSSLKKIGEGSRPFLSKEITKTARNMFTRAINNAKRQNRMNGQRLQSTSDFRFEYGLDYMLSMLELEMIGAKAQMYTKVPEAVKFLASTMAEVNCSIMPLGTGLDKDGNLAFSDVTGMAWEDALALSKAFDNVQPILVAIGREHLIAAMAHDDITMIIPYHASGSSEARYISMMQTVEEAVENRTDFADYENEHDIEDATPEQKLCRKLRIGILTGKKSKLTEKEAEALAGNEILRQLYIRVYGKDETGKKAKPDPKYVENLDKNGNDADCYRVFLTKEQAKVMMPYEYWDKTSTRKTADKQGEAYVEYCRSLGITPVFSGWDNRGKYHEDMDFTSYPGYWKVLIDRCMYNNDGSYHKQNAVSLQDVDLDMLDSKLMRDEVVKPLQVNDPAKTAGIANRSMERITAETGEKYTPIDTDSSKLSISAKDRENLERLEGHDEEWYNHHGWATVNGVLDPVELHSYISEVTNHLGKYPQNEQGLYVIPVSSRNSQGTFTILTDGAEDPSIESVWQVFDNRRDVLSEFREVFGDVKGFNHLLSDEAVEEYFGTEAVRVHRRENYDTYQESAARYEREFGRRPVEENGELSDRRGSDRGTEPIDTSNTRLSVSDPKEVLNRMMDDHSEVTSYDALENYEFIYTASDDEVYDFFSKPFSEEEMNDFYESLLVEESVVYEDPVLEEGRVRVATSKQDYYNNVNAKWNESWTTEGQVLKDESVEKDIRKLVMGVMANSNTNKKYKDDIVKKTLLDMRTAFQLMKQDRSDIASALLYHSAQRMVEDIEFIQDDTVFETYKEIRAFLRDYRISIDEEYWNDVEYNSFRKEHFPRLKLVRGEQNVEDVYQDLEDNWPHLFNENERAKIGLGDDVPSLLLHIGHVIDQNLQPFMEAYSSEEATELSFDIADQLYQIMESGRELRSLADSLNKRDAKKIGKFYDEMEKREAEYNRSIESLREQFDEQTKAMKVRHEEAIRDVEANMAALEAEKNSQISALEDRIRNDYVYSQRQLENERARSEAALEKTIAAERAKKKAAVARERAKKWEKIEKERKFNSEKRRQEREDAKARAEHKKHFQRIEQNYNELCQRVLDPTKDKYIPEEFRKSLADMLMLFDLQTYNSKKLQEKYGRPSRKTIRMTELKDRLKDLSERKGEDGTSTFEIDANITYLMDAMSRKMKGSDIEPIEGKTVDELSFNDIANIDTLLTAILHNFNRLNKIRLEDKQTEIREIGGEVVESLDTKVKKRGLARKYGGSREAMRTINMSALTPVYFFERLGALNKMYKELRRAFDQYIRNEAMITDRLEEILGPYKKQRKFRKRKPIPGSEIEKWRDDTYAQTFEIINGAETKTVTMSVAQMMSLYCLQKRDQALGHMLVGGIMVTPIESSAKIQRVRERYKGKEEAADSVILNEADIANIVSKLTPEQKKVADQLQELMAVDMAKLGNEAHREMYGYEIFNDPNYFPIKVHGTEIATDINNVSDVIQKIKSFGPAKPLVPHAANILEVDDIFSVVADHCNGMNLYNAYLVPISDFMKVLNFRHMYEDGTSRTVKEAITRAYGNKALTYVLNFMKDINGIKPASRGGLDGLLNKALGTAKKTAVFGNIRVALQQPTAIVRAAAEMKAKYLMPFVNVMPEKGVINEMYKYCPIAQWKSWGYYDTYMGRDLEDVMMNNWSMMDEALSGIYGKLDIMTWGMIWQAVKAEQADAHPNMDTKSEEFLKLCGERASEVFDKTQVVDSTFHRSDAMRSSQIAVKAFTAFMAEPTLTLNVLRAGLFRAQELSAEGDKAGAAKAMNKAISVVVVQAAFVAAAQAVADAWRGKDPEWPWGDDDDDDEETTYLTKWLHNFVANMIDQLHLENNIYFVKDITPYFNYMFSRAAKYYDWDPRLRAVMGWDQETLFSSTNLVFAGMENIGYGVGQVFSKLEKGDKYEKDWYDIIQKIASGVGTFIGIPAGTIMRDFKPILEKIVGAAFAADGFEELDQAINERISGTGRSSSDSSSKSASEDETAKAESNSKGADASGTEAEIDIDSLPDSLTDEQKQDIIDKAKKKKEKDAKKGEEGTESEHLTQTDMLYKAEMAAAGYEGEERNRRIWDAVTSGYTKNIDAGDYDTINMMRRVIEQTGGNVEYFDEQVLKHSKTALKKTIKYDQTFDDSLKQSRIYGYLKKHGMTDNEISDTILYDSAMRKELQVAMRINDEKAIQDELKPLVMAGFTQSSFEKAYKNRNRIDLKKYDGKYKDRLKSIGTYIWPISGQITSHFGHRASPGGIGSTNHMGLDIAGSMGDPVEAADGGTVIMAGWYGGAGKTVQIQHDDGTITQYSHLSWWDAKVGDTVAQGQVIGNVGSTGDSTGPHLHFGVIKNGSYVDPLEYLDKAS